MKSTIRFCSLAALLLTLAPLATAQPFQVSGEIRAYTSTDVKSASAGRIKSVSVHAGHVVQTGDLLAEVVRKSDLSLVKILAPRDGTVLAVYTLAGQIIDPTIDHASGTTLLTIGNLTKLLVETHVDQREIARFSIHQAVQITDASSANEPMEATISFIAPISTTMNSVKGFTVVALIEKPHPQLRPGAVVQLRIPTDAR